MSRSAYAYDIRLDEDRTIEVVMLEPTIDEILAAERVSKTSPLQLLQTCIVEIDGDPVEYKDLRGKGLGQRLPVKAVQALTLMMAELTSPSKEELAAVKGSKRAVAR